MKRILCILLSLSLLLGTAVFAFAEEDDEEPEFSAEEEKEIEEEEKELESDGAVITGSVHRHHPQGLRQGDLVGEAYGQVHEKLSRRGQEGGHPVRGPALADRPHGQDHRLRKAGVYPEERY